LNRAEERVALDSTSLAYLRRSLIMYVSAIRELINRAYILNIGLLLFSY